MGIKFKYFSYLSVNYNGDVIEQLFSSSSELLNLLNSCFDFPLNAMVYDNALTFQVHQLAKQLQEQMGHPNSELIKNYLLNKFSQFILSANDALNP